MTKSKECSDKGCSKPAIARGLCCNHYEVGRRAGDFQVHKKSDAVLCSCGKPLAKQATRCKVCAKDNAEANNKRKGISCKAEGCLSHRIEGKGMCQKHYLQVKRKGKVTEFGRYDANEITDEGGCVGLICRGVQGDITAIGLVDRDDKPKLLDDKWCFDKSTGYIVTHRKTASGTTKVYLHKHIAEDDPKGLILDHRSGDKLDNRKTNFRLVTVSQNGMNSRQGINEKYTVPDVKGVYFSKNKRAYVAKLMVNGKMYQRQFKLLEDAIKYRQYLAKIHHKEFAYESRPNETSPSL